MKDFSAKKAGSPIRMTPAFFFLMLSLTDGCRHGHAMARDVSDRSEGTVTLGPGSIYWSIGRLVDAGLIEETDPPTPESDVRRRFYVLTSTGHMVLADEVATLERIVDYARLRRIV